MADVLSQKQIDELLGNFKKGEIDLEKVEQPNTKKVKDYDFRSPKKVTKEQIKYITNIFDNFARFFSMHLASLLRQNCQMEIIGVEEEDYKEFNNALADSVLVGMFNVDCQKAKMQDDQILIEVGRPLSFSIMDMLLGGTGKSMPIERDYTDIELSIMEYVFTLMLPHLNNAWSNFLEVFHKLDVIETNSRIIQFVPPDVTVAIVVIKVTIADIKGIINICIPSTMFEALFPLLDVRSTKGKKDDERVNAQKDMIFDSFKDSKLEVTGILGSTDIEIQDLLELQKGDIIILNNERMSDCVKLEVEGSPWFKGSVGIEKKNYAIKISDVIN